MAIFLPISLKIATKMCRVNLGLEKKSQHQDFLKKALKKAENEINQNWKYFLEK